MVKGGNAPHRRLCHIAIVRNKAGHRPASRNGEEKRNENPQTESEPFTGSKKKHRDQAILRDLLFPPFPPKENQTGAILRDHPLSTPSFGGVSLGQGVSFFLNPGGVRPNPSKQGGGYSSRGDTNINRACKCGGTPSSPATCWHMDTTYLSLLISRGFYVHHQAAWTEVGARRANNLHAFSIYIFFVYPGEEGGGFNLQKRDNAAGWMNGARKPFWAYRFRRLMTINWRGGAGLKFWQPTPQKLQDSLGKKMVSLEKSDHPVSWKWTPSAIPYGRRLILP